MAILCFALARIEEEEEEKKVGFKYLALCNLCVTETVWKEICVLTSLGPKEGKKEGLKINKRHLNYAICVIL